jgi:hypothetical protein
MGTLKSFLDLLKLFPSTLWVNDLAIADRCFSKWSLRHNLETKGLTLIINSFNDAGQDGEFKIQNSKFGKVTTQADLKLPFQPALRAG